MSTVLRVRNAGLENLHLGDHGPGHSPNSPSFSSLAYPRPTVASTVRPELRNSSSTTGAAAYFCAVPAFGLLFHFTFSGLVS